MSTSALDFTQTRFILPPDAKVLPVAELSARARTRIGAQAEGLSVVTRQGFRVTTRLIPRPLAELLGEFRAPTLVTDAVLRFAQAQAQDPQELLDAAFDALASLVEARFLVPEDTPDTGASRPSLIAGEGFAGFEIEASVRSLDDSEVFRARAPGGQLVALKLAREARADMHAVLGREAQMLQRLGGRDTPSLHSHGVHAGRAFLAMEWCSGVSIGVAAQALRAMRDRPRLHALLVRMLHAYARLHDSGVLHGDIHPGNCLVRDDGRIVILDFGHACPSDGAAADCDIARGGIPQFHDPQTARALLAGLLPPPVTAAAEQYAIAAMAYLLLTGLYAIDTPAVHDDLLLRICERSALPFAARGVPAWPSVEQVLQRALAHDPGQRFADVAAMAHAFAKTDSGANLQRRSALRGAPERAFAAAIEGVRRLTPMHRFRRDQAWFALRAALAMDDAELLAAADLLTASAGSGWATWTVAAAVAQARSDLRAEGEAMTAFVTGIEGRSQGWPLVHAMLAASRMLGAASPRCAQTATLAAWGARCVQQLMPAESNPTVARATTDPSHVLAVLALVRSGRVAAPTALGASLDALACAGRGGVWLWGLAHDLVAQDRFRTLALSARLPATPLMRSFALMRRYQLTGEVRFLVAARRAASSAAANGLPDAAAALLAAELRMPETALPPPFRSTFGVPLQWAPPTLRD